MTDDYQDIDLRSLSDDELHLAMDLLYLDRWGNQAAQRNYVRSLYRWQL